MCAWTLEDWQALHCLAQVPICHCKPFHTNLLATGFFVVCREGVINREQCQNLASPTGRYNQPSAASGHMTEQCDTSSKRDILHVLV